MTHQLRIQNQIQSRLPAWVSARNGASLAIRLTLGALALGAVLFSSVALYGVFYQLYVPKLLHEAAVHLQYGAEGAGSTTAHIDFVGKRDYRFLSTSQAYTVTLDLTVPTSEYNEGLGNFMIALDLLTATGRPVVSSARAAILPYRSGGVRALHTVVRAVPLALGLLREQTVLNVVLADGIYDKHFDPIVAARLSLSCPLHVYSASLVVAARFAGLRYWMYYCRAPVAVLFVAAAALWQLVLMAVAWSVLESYATRRSAAAAPPPPSPAKQD
ncbi:hypothetical protein GGI04_004103 [Coemansia thaxteri]|uniref:Seipin n=1 Tax=Coemansia thaxteri TaxID=2663907 RepID=A0A9W8EEY2_9FUNG|nr:hypothetical protein GGI04_004103 [Coemansia thaxteri]KAJ2003299.1 hypothetical protein H4R26_003150 [Coemansia thaxteri]KAJ2468238.1 hypothetical protein GGI02_003769 [Coemansia sp. RSA 2322]